MSTESKNTDVTMTLTLCAKLLETLGEKEAARLTWEAVKIAKGEETR